VQPSIIFIAVRRYYILDEQGIVGAPDLIVEIWSPSNKKKERGMKHDLYEMHGVTEISCRITVFIVVGPSLM